MKKYVLVALIAMACMIMAIPAFAAHTFTPSDTTVIGGANFVPSTNVNVSAAALPSSDTSNPNTYCVTAVHGASVNQTAGRAYGALSSQSGIDVLNAPTNVSSCACTDSISLPTGFAAVQ
jgi:hypothetical protein